MSIDTVNTLNSEQAEAVKNLDRALKDIWTAPIRSNKYLSIVANIKECVLALGRTHPNWNETTQEPDGIYEEWDAPKGAKTPMIDPQLLPITQTLIEEVIVQFKSARLENPTLDDVNYYESFRNKFSSLRSYHPKFNERNGEIED